MPDDTADTPTTSNCDDPSSDPSPTEGDTTGGTSGDAAVEGTKPLTRLTCLRNVYVLESDDGAIWLAVTPAAGEGGTAGVMPHLLPGQGATVTGTTEDGDLSVIIKGDGRTVLDAVLTAYPLPAPLVPVGFGRTLHTLPLDG